MCLIEWFLGVWSCVLTVGISPTKSMSTKNPKLGKIMLQYKILLKGQDIYVYTYIFVIYVPYLSILRNVFDSDYILVLTLGVPYVFD